MLLCMDLVKQYMRDNPQLKVLIVDSEHNVDVGTQGHTDWGKLKGLEAREWCFDEDTYNKLSEHKAKRVNKHTVKAKPLYTQLLGRWGK